MKPPRRCPACAMAPENTQKVLTPDNSPRPLVSSSATANRAGTKDSLGFEDFRQGPDLPGKGLADVSETMRTEAKPRES